MKDRVKETGPGSHLAGARILVSTEYRIEETLHRSTLADIRLDDIGQYEGTSRADLWQLFDIIRKHYESYSEGTVTIELSIKDLGVNW